MPTLKSGRLNDCKAVVKHPLAIRTLYARSTKRAFEQHYCKAFVKVASTQSRVLALMHAEYQSGALDASGFIAGPRDHWRKHMFWASFGAQAEKLWFNLTMRIIFFSPHLDDAVLSAGGWIWSQTDGGVPVEIWTFMSGKPETGDLPDFARAMHRVWGFESANEAVTVRRAEDMHAAAEVGARAVHFDFLDCIYRRGKLGQALYSDVEVPVHLDELDLPAQIAQTMVAWLQPDDAVVCQLGIGGHVDHVLIRQAAEMLHRPLVYDADIPYLLNHPDELASRVEGLHKSFQPVAEIGYRHWIAAIECYASQVESVFGSHESMQQQMSSYWLEQRGIRFWQR